MAAVGSLQLSLLGISKNHLCTEKFRNPSFALSSTYALGWKSWNPCLSCRSQEQIYSISCPRSRFKCNSSMNNPVHSICISSVKTAALTLVRSCNNLQGNIFVHKFVPAIGVLLFGIWGIGPLMRQSRKIIFQKSDNSWQKSSTHHLMTSYFQPLLLWTGALLICRALDTVNLPTESSQIVKQRLLNFVRSSSTVVAFAYCISSVIQQSQKFFMETSDPSDTRNMGFQFAGKALYTAVWVAAASLFMELLGFSTQKWLTAGGLGTVLLTLAGREIFTNFLSSAMIHATRPFVMNEWIQTKIEGYEVSGTVEHVGWWSPTVVRGEDREAVHIPNHKFTVNVVRNLTQKTHWRIKTHLAISHWDVNKINIIVADMRKVLAKNPQVEQQKLHRRVFLDNINPENQALLILISCFVKTSHFEEYLCVKESILLDLLRVIRHHRARLATPIRTVQKMYNADMEDLPFGDSIFNRGTTPNQPVLLIEPSYKINGEEKGTKSPGSRSSGRVNGEDGKTTPRSTTPDNKTDSKSGTQQSSESKEENKVEGTTESSSSSSSNVEKSDGGGEKPGKQLKQQGGKLSDASGAPTTSTKQVMEENIVLGVALKGSKKTLPIEEEEEETVTAKSNSDTKEPAAYPSGNGPPAADLGSPKAGS